MKVKIQKLSPLAEMPHKAHSDDFCYDVVATSEEEIAPNVWKYGIGLAFEVERDNQATADIAIQFFPRSSVWKTGMMLSNSCGIIDEGYRGEVSAVFYHIMPNLPRYRVGERIGQIKLGFTTPIDFEWASALSATERGKGGYGSSGK